MAIQFIVARIANPGYNMITIMKSDRINTVILIFLAVALLSLLYYVTGGNWSAWLGDVSEGGTASPLEMVTNSLNALGRAIGDVFSGFFR